MKRIKYLILLAVVMAFAMIATSAFAGTAYNAAFTTSITYQNVSDSEGQIVFRFYEENTGTSVDVERNLAAGASGSLFVGSLNGSNGDPQIDSGFTGSAVMTSNVPMVATMVQISSDSDVRNRPLSNGFTSGSDSVLLATVVKNKFNSTSRFSVQNAHSDDVDLSITFFDADDLGAAPITITHSDLPSGAAKYFDMGTISAISASVFNGSATISATDSTTGDPAPVVASVLELKTNSGGASSFEGVNSGSSTVYMPSALCNFGSSSQNSFYAVQNTETVDVDVEVTYSDGSTDNATIPGGAKNSFRTCDGGVGNGFSGSATISAVLNSDGVTSANVIVVGKVTGGTLGTAFVGASAGADTLALPYCRWTTSEWTTGKRQRAFLAIQNIGSSLNAGDVTVEYINKDGDVVGVHSLGSLAEGEKTNSTASAAAVQTGFAQSDLDEFGYVGGFGGGCRITGPEGSQLVAVVRIVSNIGGSARVGEDYNGIAVD